MQGVKRAKTSLKLATLVVPSRRLAVKEAIKALVRDTLRKFNIRAGDYDVISLAICKADGYDRIPPYLVLLQSLPNDVIKLVLPHVLKARSQIGQDLFVQATLNFKQDGYFVEFGATNGVDLSNSFMLEKSFGWNGILAEPAMFWHDALKKNRECNIDTACVWRVSNSSLEFNEVNAAAHSTLNSFSDGDCHASLRKKGRKYKVETISLVDLLDKHRAPADIDYLSLDTEGSEFEILNAFDFDKYRFKIITCEHNHTANRDKIYSLLSARGYQRTMESVSDFDDRYVRNDIINR